MAVDRSNPKRYKKDGRVKADYKVKPGPKKTGGRKKKKEPKKKGRPSKMTSEKLFRVEEAFSMGCSDLEACLYADISQDTLYYYQAKNPEFSKRKAILKEKTILLARQEVVKGLKNNHEFSMKYLERKKKAEFSPRTEHSGPDGNPIEIRKLSEEQLVTLLDSSDEILDDE